MSPRFNWSLLGVYGTIHNFVHCIRSILRCNTELVVAGKLHLLEAWNNICQYVRLGKFTHAEKVWQQKSALGKPFRVCAAGDAGSVTISHDKHSNTWRSAYKLDNCRDKSSHQYTINLSKLFFPARCRSSDVGPMLTACSISRPCGLLLDAHTGGRAL
jgi:hypothetical protein